MTAARPMPAGEAFSQWTSLPAAAERDARPLRPERPLLLLVLLGAVGFAMAEGSGFYLALVAAGVLINGVGLWRGWEIHLPRLVVNAAVLLATGFFLIDFLATPNFFYPLGHYLLLIQLCKLFERKRNRDYVQILALSVVLVLDGALVTTGLWFGLLMLVYVPVACYVGMALSLKVALDRQTASRLTVEVGAAGARGPAVQVPGQFSQGKLWPRAFGASLACALVAAVVFLLMPRGSPGALFELPRIARGRAGVSGFPDSFALTDLGRITADPRVVMEVRLERDGWDLGPTGFCGYLRGRIYSTYQRGEWFGQPGQFTWRAGRGPWRTPLPKTRGIITQRVTMDPSLLPMTFAIAPIARVELPGGLEFVGLYPDTRVDRQRSDAPVRYTAYSFARPFSPPQREQLAELRRRGPPPAAIRTRGVGPGRPRRAGRGEPGEGIPSGVAELARQWCADLLAARDALSEAETSRREELDYAIARRIAAKLSDNYTYTLDLSAADPDRDPVEDFLFHTRRGHCQFFASAMVLMCRAVGVRARLAGGFLASEYNPAAGGYLVRAAHAHAWCEVYTPWTDWIVVDPTPAEARQRLSRSPGWLANIWAAMRFYWGTRVIGYGEADRQNLFGRFLDRLRRTGLAVHDLFQRAGRAAWNLLALHRFGWDQVVSALPIFSSGLAVMTLTWLLVALIQRRKGLRRVRVHPSLPECYHSLVKLLWRRGHRQRPHQTPREFLFGLADELGLPRDRLAGLADLLYQIRWGHSPPSAAGLHEAEQTVQQVVRRLKQG